MVEDREIEDPKEILEEQKKFYENLYSSKKNKDSVREAEFFLCNNNINRLSEEQKDSCEGIIKENEVKAVIKNIKNGKSPGSDGFPIEFYKVFWLDIGEYLLRSLNFAFHKGQLSITQKQGIITCLPKSENRELMKNWRPITLLNVDYKILSGVLSRRLRGILKDIISQEQKGFLAERYIGENTRLVYDVMQHLAEKNKKGLIMLIDFEKAFDSLEWNYIEKVLMAYNFGDEFRKWCAILYRDSQSCVINGGHFSKFFNLERGCRQGDPLSPYIFILAAEPLAMSIKNSDRIKGIKIKTGEHTIGQYADDTFIFLDGSDSSLKETIRLLDKFAKGSGLKVNVDKTQVAWLGSERFSLDRLCPHVKLKWVTSFKLLGIKFNVNLDEMIELNYKAKLDEIEQMLTVYHKRYLSLIGKVTVIKSLAIPKLLHLLSVLPAPPEKYIEKLESVFKKFLWNNKRSRISYEQMCKKKEKGGLNLTHVKTLIQALKISWIQRLLQGKGGWQDLFAQVITKDYEQIWELDTESLVEFGMKITNKFWKEVFISWKEYRVVKDKIEEFIYFPIWNTSFCKVKGILKQKETLQRKGLNYVKDLMDINGNVLGYSDFKTKFGTKVNFVDFYSLMHCIKYEWKHAEITDIKEEGSVRKNINKIRKTAKVCKHVYLDLVQNVKYTNNSEEKWSNTGILVAENEWEHIYMTPFKVTIQSKLQSFQYQILKRFLVPNKLLYLCKIKYNNNCHFCKAHIETIEHLFFDCKAVHTFWMNVTEWLPVEFEFRRFVSRKMFYLVIHNVKII